MRPRRIRAGGAERIRVFVMVLARGLDILHIHILHILRAFRGAGAVPCLPADGSPPVAFDCGGPARLLPRRAAVPDLRRHDPAPADRDRAQSDPQGGGVSGPPCARPPAAPGRNSDR